MLKFSIIIPFRPKVETDDWVTDCVYLTKTVLSLLRQTYDNIQIYVVCTDMPERKVIDDRVRYILSPYEHQLFENMKNRETLLALFKSPKLVVRRWDKSRKLCYGAKIAKQDGCDYIMAMDGDDRLSKYFFERLAILSKNGECDGWYMEKGYLYIHNNKYVIKVPHNLRFLNGSTHVLHQRLVSVPDFNSLEWVDYSLFTDHGWIKDRVKDQYNAKLQPVSFPALVYIVHLTNISKVRKEYSFALRKFIKRLMYGTILTPKIREEFYLY